MEGLAEIGREGDCDLIRLALVAHVEGGFEQNVFGVESLRGEVGTRSSEQGRQRFVEERFGDLRSWFQDRRGVVLDDVGEQHAERGEDAGVLRDENGRDVERVGEVACMQAAGAAEGEQCEVARIEATLHADHADGALHVGVGDAHDAFSEGALM